MSPGPAPRASAEKRSAFLRSRAPLLLAPLALLLLGPAEPGDGTLDQASALAAADGKPILLIFPPGRAADASSALDDRSVLRRAQAKFHLARVRSVDLQNLRDRFQVKRVPALILIDCHGGLWERWEPTIPADLWAQVDRSGTRLKSLEDEVTKALAASRTALDRRDFAGALSGARKVLARVRAGYPESAAASAVEGEVLARAGDELRRALGREAIAPDAEVLADLKRLRAAFPHPDAQSLIDREAARIRARQVGGSTESGKSEVGSRK